MHTHTHTHSESSSSVICPKIVARLNEAAKNIATMATTENSASAGSLRHDFIGLVLGDEVEATLQSLEH